MKRKKRYKRRRLLDEEKGPRRYQSMASSHICNGQNLDRPPSMLTWYELVFHWSIYQPPIALVKPDLQSDW